MFLRASGAAITRYTPSGAEFVEMRFDGARAGGESEGEEPLASYSNYYLGRDERSWFTGIAHFGRVRYHDVYPGIDVVYRSSGTDIEYDFDVHAGADPSVIRINFHGVDSLRTSNGDLILTSGGQELRQRRPRVWQDGVEISGDYRIDGGHVEIALADYDPGRPLLIDPVIQFASYLGGPGAEYVGAIQVDSQGSLYLAGYTSSVISPALDPFTQSGLVVESPVVFKFISDGSRLLFFLTMAVDNRTVIDGHLRRHRADSGGVDRARRGAHPGQRHAQHHRGGVGEHGVHVSRLRLRFRGYGADEWPPGTRHRG
jgi:hypothetical protein